MKTNILKNLKQGMFLLIAIMATSVGHSQSTQNPTIGGMLFEIGGGGGNQSAPRDTGSGMIVFSFDTKTNFRLANQEDIGGRGSGGKGTDSGSGQLDTGGVVIGRLLTLIDIGSGGKGSDSAGGLFTLGNIGGRDAGTGPFAANDIGGSKTPQDTGGLVDTGGGKSSDGGLGTGKLDFEIGGRGSDTGTGQFTSCDIGGGGKGTGAGDTGLIT